jgi:hypothetical protein
MMNSTANLIPSVWSTVSLDEENKPYYPDSVYEVWVEVAYMDGTNSISPKISVIVDNTLPVLTVPTTITVNATSSVPVVFNATATDANPDTTVGCLPVSNSLFAFGTTTVTCTATDKAGNVATKSFNVIVNDVNPKDTTAPVITLTGSSTINLNVGDSYEDAGATATDNVDVTVTVIPTGTVDTTTPGTYTITYSATDLALNVATPVTRTVIVSAVVTPPVVISSRNSSGGSRRPITPPGQVLGAETTNWDNLSPAQKEEILKTLRAMLEEIIKALNELIANGTIK